MIILTSVIIISSIIGCETNKDLTLEIEKEYLISYKTTVTSLDSVVIPSQVNSDFEKHKFDIQSASLQNATYTVTSLQPPTGKKADSLKVDSIGIKIGDIFGNSQTYFTSLKNIYLNRALTPQSLNILSNDGQTKLENFIGNAPYSTRLYLKYTNPLDSTVYKVKFNFAFKVTYKQKTP